MIPRAIAFRATIFSRAISPREPGAAVVFTDGDESSSATKEGPIHKPRKLPTTRV